MKSPIRHAAVVSVALLVAGWSPAADVTWNNGSGDFLWNTTSNNWGAGVPWNNASNDAAVFGATGVGTVGVPGSITARSLDFQTTGYTLAGAGSLNLTSAGSGTLGAGVVRVGTGTARIDAAITSTVGLQKLGGGVLELGGTNAITGAFPITSDGLYKADVMIGVAPVGTTSGGTLRLLSGSALAPTTSVGIGNGYLDIGANNVTLANLRFTNQNPNDLFWNATLNANNGVIGTGTLRVTGEITVNGHPLNSFSNNGNAVAANVDLGGGTQVLRVGRGNTPTPLSTALLFTGTLSNGSLLKTTGPQVSGGFGLTDGVALFGNNTYTGSTVLNGGPNLATGTNASTSLKIVNGTHTLLGANGSYLGATAIQVYSGGTLALDNNATVGARPIAPPVFAAQNNDRIRDDVAIELRDGGFLYQGRVGVVASETYGSLTANGGHNTLTISPLGTGGTATLTAAGGLTLAPRATLQVAGAALGGTGQVKFIGGVPAADATGILPRVVGTSNFLTYNAATGLTPFTGYATDFNTPGANVALTADATAPTVAINALKMSDVTTATISPGSTLTISSGMILSNPTGFLTIAGGTLAFGSNPGVLFGTGSTQNLEPFGGFTITSAMTGNAGLIVASGNATLSGDLSGLSGPLTVHTDQITVLNTNTFAGPVEVRVGTLRLGSSQGPGGAITLGVPQNDANLVARTPTLSLANAGANATFARDIVVDNGAMTAAGVSLLGPQAAYIPVLTPLSNSLGSQTISGNVTLNTSLLLSGGGGGGTGSTDFTGTVAGAGTFVVRDGRASFSGVLSSTGGFLIADTANSADVSFLGTTTGSVLVTINGGTSVTVRYNATGLPTGALTVQKASGSTAPSLIPLASSTINNAIALNGDAIANVGAGITGTWAGVLSGTGTLTKTGAGTLVLSNTGNTHAGPVAVNAGRLSVSGILPTGGTVTVNSGGTFDGSGAVSRNITVAAGGTLAPGADASSSLAVNGTTTLTGAATGTGAILSVRAARGSSANSIAAADRLSYIGAVNFSGLATGTPTATDNKFRIQIVSDAANPLVHGETYALVLASGTGQLQRNGTQVNTAAYTFNANDYELSSPTFTALNSVSLVATADGNLVLAFSPVPEPASAFAVGGAALAAAAFARRRVWKG